MRTAASVSELQDNLGISRKQGSCGSSKADKLLGSGVGEIDSFSVSILFCTSTEWNELYLWKPKKIR